ISARFSTRLPLLAKRGSLASEDWPAASQNFRNRLSLPQARITAPSLVRNGWEGTLLGCRLPMRFGGLPVEKKLVFWYASSAIWESSSARSRCWPAPVSARGARAGQTCSDD